MIFSDAIKNEYYSNDYHRLCNFAVVMLAFAIYEMKHAYEVDTNDETFLD